MLTRLHVKNYILIDSLDIDFPEGLVIITGQTGAGKSILLGALSLLMGSKADASTVSGNADSCVVEAEFDMEPANSLLRNLIEDNDAEWDEGHLIIRRTVNKSGRSRAFVNDSPVSVSVLQEISSHLIDIHSQHQTMVLSDKRFQLDTLDHFAGNSELRSKCDELWRQLGTERNELRAVEERIARLSLEKDYNEAQYRQLESAGLRVGELSELEEEQKQLANAEEIKTNLGGVEELFSPSTDAQSTDSVLKEMSRLLARVSKYIPAVSELSERVDVCRRELDDIFSEVSSINSGVDMSSERLDTVEDRMSFLYSLLQKHGCQDESELIAVRDRLAEELFDSTSLEERRNGLKARISELESAFDEVALCLHASREQAVPAFCASMTDSIRELELQHAVFDVELSDVPAGACGKDAVVFRFSATGRNPLELFKCASGGELSRIMLALKAMRAKYVNMPTMIFDEIDTGVSGSVADKMGSVICDMGNHMQVFAITHLPQVAAKGSAHYLVAKETDSAINTVSTIKRLSDDQRVLEIARMLSGANLTDAAIANAKSLLGG